MTIITAVEPRMLRIPLDHPTSFSNRTVFHRDHPVVTVRCADGSHGIGFCYAGNSNGRLVAEAVTELLGPVLIGQDPHRVEGLWAAMYQEALLHGRAGVVMRGISMLDIALWDRNSRAAGLPLWRMLGGYYEETVPAYASGGYYLEGKGHEGLQAELEGYVEMGFDAVKIKVGRLSVREEAARIQAAREAIGPDVHLMLDANNAWANLEDALRYMAAYGPAAPYWIEEPFPPDAINLHAKLAERTGIPVATGEIEAGRWRFQELIDKNAAMILQPDAAVLGGITEFRRIAAAAAVQGVSICPHWFHDLHRHLVASSPNATYVEFFPDDQVHNFRNVIDTQTEVLNGRLLLPETPGLGFDLLPEAIERYALD